jgi:D-alanine-D-alanine ligase
MPPAEMCFSEAYYETKPRILGYKAKWDDSSPEYLNTARSFQFKDTDNELLSKLKEISGKCWEIFGLNGYARVDIRVDKDNTPQVIEINANPCLSPGSGLMAACEQFGLTKTEVINRIIKASKT